MTPGSHLRALAAHVVHEVTQGKALSDCLENALLTLKEKRDRAFVQAVCYGVCRFYFRLDIILSYLLKKSLAAKESELHALLLVGLYQLMEMRVPPHAAVAETVNASAALRPWARGFTNAILREYLRQRSEIEERLKADVEGYYAHPKWWIDAIKKAWPHEWQAVLTANNGHPPLALRVNQKHISRSAYLEKLEENKLTAYSIPETLSGVLLDTPTPIEAVPGFAEGEISVQDGAAQLAASLLDLKPNLRILDACAAPGGKLTHLLEITPNPFVIVAVEKDRQRLALIKENLTRLHFFSQENLMICHDAADVAGWWDGQLFDRILLDAPCTASGVVRRHPDIKLLRRPTDIVALAKTQLQLLTALWATLKVNGLLVYATCSIFPEENVQVLQRFLAANANAKEEKITTSWGMPCTIGRQILPGMHQMDGFYYAKIRKEVG